MDRFGIGNALLAMYRVYVNQARGTGRTTQMISNLKDGDTVCFTNAPEARRVQRLCKERGFEIHTIVVDPLRSHELIEKTQSLASRVVLDHTLIERMYQVALERVQATVSTVERTSAEKAAAREQLDPFHHTPRIKLDRD